MSDNSHLDFLRTLRKYTEALSCPRRCSADRGLGGRTSELGAKTDGVRALTPCAGTLGKSPALSEHFLDVKKKVTSLSCLKDKRNVSNETISQWREVIEQTFKISRLFWGHKDDNPQLPPSDYAGRRALPRGPSSSFLLSNVLGAHSTHIPRGTRHAGCRHNYDMTRVL